MRHPPPDPYMRAADQRGGAYSILTGVAANHSMRTDQLNRIDDFVHDIGLPDYPSMPVMIHPFVIRPSSTTYKSSRTKPIPVDKGGIHMAQVPDSQKLRVISKTENAGFRVEVMEYTSLDGCRDLSSAEALFYAKQAGIRLKLVRITINQSAAILEAGALYFLKG